MADISIGGTLAPNGPFPLVRSEHIGLSTQYTPGVDRITRYVRNAGNDTTGDGLSAGTAYATIQRALADCPAFLAWRSFRVDVTGYTYTLTDMIRFPNVVGSLIHQLAYASEGAFIGADIEFFAAMPAVLTVPGGYTVTSDPDTLMGTITLPGAGWTVNQWKDKIIGFPGYSELGRIVSNTATQLVTNFSGGYIGDGSYTFELREESCTLDLDTSGYFAATYGYGNNAVSGCNATVSLNGIKLTGGYGSFYNFDAPRVSLLGCSMWGLDGHPRCIIEAYGCDIGPGPGFAYYGTISGPAINITLYNCRLHDLYELNNDQGKFGAYGCYGTNCDAYGSGYYHGFLQYARGSVDVQYCVMRDNPWGGIRLFGTPDAHASYCRFDNCGYGGIRLERMAQLVIDGNIAGAGNGLGGGVTVLDGSRIFLGSNMTLAMLTVTGTTGDLSVGTLPVRTWNDFFNNPPTYNQTDTDGDGSAVFGRQGTPQLTPAIPRRTSAQVTALGAVPDGTAVIDTTTAKALLRLGNTWQTLAPASTQSALKTANHTALKNELVLCNPTAGAFNVTAPVVTAGAPRFGVKNKSNSLNPITILPDAGHTIEGGASLTMATPRAVVWLEFDGTSDWMVVS